MSHTYASILCHVIFSTKNRQPLIADTFRTRLYEYMCGLARNEFGAAIAVRGTADHVHGLLSLRTDVSVAHAMNRWKSLSSGWVNKTLSPRRRFAWQTGYAAFSVSESSRLRVVRYIERQVEHHRRQTFEEELIALLRRHRIDYDPQHVWD